MTATHLYQRHVDLNAKMIDFSGWQMPLRYSSQIQEHKAVRETCGLFDVSHMLAVDIHGEDARKFMRTIHCNDVGKSTDSGSGLYGCMLNEQGGVIDDLICYVINEKHYRIVVNAGRRDADLDWIRLQSARLNVTIDARNNYGILALQGPDALKILTDSFTQTAAVRSLRAMQGMFVNDELFIARSGYTGEDGVEIIAPQETIAQYWDTLIAADVQPCGLGARDSLRLEAGMCLYGHELSETISPLEASIGWCVDWSDAERAFIGKSALEEQKKNGRNKKLVGLLLQEKGIMRAEQHVADELDNTIGFLTSGGFSPMLNTSIGLALIDASYKEDTCHVLGRNKVLCKVTKPAFVRKGKLLV